MKTIVVLAMCGLVTSGCSTMFASDSKLIETAAFDSDCPKEKIQILEKQEGMDYGRYTLEVCGTKQKYKRTGNVYHKADVDPARADR